MRLFSHNRVALIGLWHRTLFLSLLFLLQPPHPETQPPEQRNEDLGRTW